MPKKRSAKAVKPVHLTTLIFGEENIRTTMALGEEVPFTTLVEGEEHPTTTRIGEEGKLTSFWIGEESFGLKPLRSSLGKSNPKPAGADFTTLVGGEEGGTTKKIGEESVPPSTKAKGEESFTTLVVGEEDFPGGGKAGNPFGIFKDL